MEITCPCPQCKEWTSAHDLKAACPACKAPLFELVTEDLREELSLNQCPACGSAHLYRQKDFNRKIGVAILVVGVALAYFTYGISLLIVTVIDLLMFKQVKELGICYQCGAQFRDSKLIDALEPFDLVLHDHYMNRKK